MPAIYHLRNGTPPSNIANLFETTMNDIEKDFGAAELKFMGVFPDNIPVINPSYGTAKPGAQPEHVVIQVSRIELPHKLFPKGVGFYQVVDVRPNY